MTATSPRVSGSVVVDADNPWPGLEAFHEQDHEFFYGRDQEVDELRRRVLSERLTVLFGLSGLGKTSLVRAGLFPRLHREGVLPIYIRLDYSDGSSDLRTQVKSKLTEAATTAQIEAPSISPTETLWELFHREDVDFWDRSNRLVTPLLVFDQFEEIFTLGTDSPEQSVRIGAFLEELGNLIEGRPPAAVRTRLEREPDDVKHFVFDRHRYKLLLSLREDFLPDLESLRGAIPSVIHNRLRLRRMSGDRALSVVTKAGGRLVEEDVARRIVCFVAGVPADKVEELEKLELEPALLSLFCRELNNKRRHQDMPQITADLLKGRASEILADFYERSFDSITPPDVRAEVRYFIEDRLITASGYRDSVARDNLPASFTQEVLNRLVDRRLLRVEERGRVHRIELTHDVLTDVTRSSRDSRREQEEKARAERARRQAEERAHLAQRQLRRSRRTVIVFGALTLVALLLAGVTYSALTTARSARQQAEQQRQAAVAVGQRAKAEALRARITDRQQNRDLTDALALIPRSAPGSMYWSAMRGQAFSDMRQYDSAIAEYRKALRLGPEVQYVMENLCYAYEVARRFRDGIEQCGRVLQRVPGSFLGHLNLAFAWVHEGAYDSAKSSLLRAMDATRYHSQVMWNSDLSARIRQATGKGLLTVEGAEVEKTLAYGLVVMLAYEGTPGFEAALDAADRLKPSYDAVLYALLWSSRISDETETAPVQSATEPSDYGVYVAEGALWERLGVWEQATRAYRDFQKAHERHSEPRYQALAKWVTLRLRPGAKPHTLSFQPLDAPLLALEAQEFEDRGQLDSALARLDSALVLTSDTVYVLLRRARVWDKLLWASRGEDRHRMIQDSLLAAADGIIARAPTMGEAHYFRGRARDAPEDLQRAVEYDPSLTEAAYLLYGKRRNGSVDEALHLLRMIEWGWGISEPARAWLEGEFRWQRDRLRKR